MFDSEYVMGLDDEPEAFLKIVDVSHTNGFSDQAGDTVAPFVVQAFDDAGFAAAFTPWPMLPGSEPFGVGSIEIAVDQFSAISSG